MDRAVDLRIRYEPKPGVLVRSVGGEAVLLDPQSWQYYGLDAHGLRVWELLGSGTLSEVVTVLEREFEAPRGELERDVAALVAELAGSGLVVPCAADAAQGEGAEPAR